MNYYIAREMNGMLVFRGHFTIVMNAISVAKQDSIPYKIVTETERNDALYQNKKYADVRPYDYKHPISQEAVEIVIQQQSSAESVVDPNTLTIWKIKRQKYDTKSAAQHALELEQRGKNRRGVVEYLKLVIAKLK